MLAAETPATSGHQIYQLKSGRKPLQPRNIPATPNDPKPNPKSTTKHVELSSAAISSFNKENNLAHKTPLPPPAPPTPPVLVEPLSLSLAEELSAVRERLERLKIDREGTEGMLRERDLVMDSQLKEVRIRGEVQKELEIEVDRLYRLKQLQVSCMQRSSPIRSLRAQQMEKQHTRASNVEVLRSGCKEEEESSDGTGDQSLSATVETVSSASA